MLSVVAFEFIGTGLVLPFWVVYLHEIRGYSLDVVGLLIAGMSAAGVVTSIPGGTLIDRIGPRRAMIGVLIASIVGEVVMAFAVNLPLAILGVVIVGGGFGLGWPAVQAMICLSAVRGRIGRTWASATTSYTTARGTTSTSGNKALMLLPLSRTGTTIASAEGLGRTASRSVPLGPWSSRSISREGP